MICYVLIMKLVGDWQPDIHGVYSNSLDGMKAARKLLDGACMYRSWTYEERVAKSGSCRWIVRDGDKFVARHIALLRQDMQGTPLGALAEWAE